MISVSAAFNAALVASHRIATLVEIWSPPTASSPAALLYSGPYVTDGNVKVDATNAIRRSGQLTVVDPTGTLTPATAGDILSPLAGNEAYIYRGITYPSGATELVLLGVIGLSDTTVTDEGAGLTIALSGYDRARRVQRAKLTDTYAISAGTNVVTAIQALVSSRVPGLTYAMVPTAYTTPGVIYQTGDDPWQRATELAASIGYELFFDNAGTCVCQPVPDPTTAAPVWTYSEGMHATIVKLARQFKDDDTYNDVIVTGEGTGVGVPVRAQVQDTNPASPTYVNGPYGDVVSVISSSLVTTTAQALAMAQATLTRSVGVAESLTFDAIVNPAHDVNDVITVNRARSWVASDYVIDALTIPLRADAALTAVARRKTS